MKILMSVPFLIYGYIALTTLYGLYLGFSASIYVGIGYLVISPLSFLTGLFNQFGYNLAERIAQTLGLA